LTHRGYGVMLAGRANPRLPFGGIRDSGYGRELSRLGIRECANQQTLWLA